MVLKTRDKHSTRGGRRYRKPFNYRPTCRVQPCNLWMCQVCEPEAQFDTPGAFLAHCETTHPDLLTEGKLVGSRQLLCHMSIQGYDSYDYAWFVGERRVAHQHRRVTYAKNDPRRWF